ncbi:MAG: hypothetical protein EOO06_03525 [Chitinophagaceae bacterium]|nr:MAG: hypothetical protein EOO06_03525 [Chitinophagaceae bacterium]
MRHFLILSLFFLIIHTSLCAQQPDKFVGTWTFQKTDVENKTYRLTLQLGNPEAATLYPSLLTVEYAQFTGIYQVLLVKKNEGQLAVGRQKFPVQEIPFSIGAYTIPLNGTVDFAGGRLVVNRIPANRYGFPVPALSVYEEENKIAVLRVSEFLRNEPIQLQKINNTPLRSASASNMLFTHSAPDYFGLVDSFYVRTRMGSIQLSENTSKVDVDTVSVKLNGRMIINRVDISRNEPPVEITLDSGMNILCFFADNYGSIPPNTGKLDLSFGPKKFTLDFTTRQNRSAGFIVAKIFVLPENQQTPTEITTRKIISEKVEQRKTTWIDSIRVSSREVTLALWDDAVEDGDSISLQINEELFLPGIAVKKKPQFIDVKLYPGDNKIVFIADNLGAIPPNTSILEIIDGKKRRSYMINTDLRQNSAIKITYELGPDN